MSIMQEFFEKYAFGVCTRLGEKLRLPTSDIRLFFIYSSFLTFGSPVIIYLGLAFVMKFRKALRRRNNTLWYY
ncbi:MAG: PspC family transcriptional regulator [Cyclobacteriaceae bacterium]